MKSERRTIKKLYYSIGEVSKITGLKQYVLRYWETEFRQLNPSKNKAGNRTYRQKDIDLILQIKDLLYQRRFTIEGARAQLAREEVSEIMAGEDQTPATGGVKEGVSKELLLKLRQELKALLDSLYE
ncbi:MAG: MerR family transcriptional regulator [Fidelibacterota bacterium]